MQHATDCRVHPIAPRAEADAIRDAGHIDLALAGMGCVNCANRVRNALLARRGIVDVQIDVQAALARVWYDPTVVSVHEMVAAVADAGGGTQHRYLAVPVGLGEVKVTSR